MALVTEIKLNCAGQEESFKLNETEAMALAQMKDAACRAWGSEARVNDLGYDQIITTLSAVETRVARQKNLEFGIEEAIDVVEGVGAWKEQGVYFKSFANGGDTLDSWRIDQAQMGATKSQATASVAKETYPLMFLAKMCAYTRVELEQAAASGIWNAIEEKSWARRREFDLRFAELVYKGTADGIYHGLLTLPNVHTETDTVITSRLCDMNDTQFQAAINAMFSLSYTTSEYTAKPNRLLIPELDRIGLAATWSSYGSGFAQGITRLQRLEEAFRNYTGDANAKVIGTNFANGALNGGVETYAMYRKDPFELKIEMPVPYGIYPGASVDGFNFQDTALAQVSGVVSKYEKQFVYFKNTL